MSLQLTCLCLLNKILTTYSHVNRVLTIHGYGIDRCENEHTRKKNMLQW